MLVRRRVNADRKNSLEECGKLRQKAQNQNISHIREGTFFVGGGGGAGEFGVFFPKKVLALPCVLMKTLLPPTFR